MKRNVALFYLLAAAGPLFAFSRADEGLAIRNYSSKNWGWWRIRP